MSDNNNTKEELLELIKKFSDVKLLEDFCSVIDEVGVCGNCGKMVDADTLDYDSFFTYSCVECQDKKEDDND